MALTLAQKRRLLTVSPSYLPPPLSLVLGLAEQFIFLMGPVAAPLSLSFPIPWVCIDKSSAIEVQCLPRDDSECSQGDTRPFLTLTFPVCHRFWEIFIHRFCVWMHMFLENDSLCFPGWSGRKWARHCFEKAVRRHSLRSSEETTSQGSTWKWMQCWSWKETLWFFFSPRKPYNFASFGTFSHTHTPENNERGGTTGGSRILKICFGTVLLYAWDDCIMTPVDTQRWPDSQDRKPQAMWGWEGLVTGEDWTWGRWTWGRGYMVGYAQMV